MKAFWLLIPIITGLAVPALVAMNLRMAARTGAMEAAVVLHAVGTLAGLLVIGAGMRGPGFGALADVPGWAFFGGVIGVASMALMNRAIPQIGVANAITLSVAAQLVASVLCEHFGWLGTERSPAGMTRWIGVALLVVGAALVQRR